MPHQHRRRQNKCCRVSLVFAFDVKADVTASGFEDCDFPTHIATRNDARTSDEASANVGQDAAVQVGHDHDVELLWSRYALHRGIVDDHVVCFQSRVIFCDLLECVSEETVGKLHDIGLVYAGDLPPIVRQSEGEGELGDSLRFCPCYDLERLDDAAYRLMLEAGIFAFGVLADNTEVNILVSGFVAGDVLDKDDGGVNVELLSQSNVE